MRNVVYLTIVILMVSLFLPSFIANAEGCITCNNSSVNVSVNISSYGGGDGGGGGSSSPGLHTGGGNDHEDDLMINMFGTIYWVSVSGEITQEGFGESGETIFLTISDFTSCVDKDGNELREIYITRPELSSPCFNDYQVIDVYQFSPDGAVFTPDLILTFHYNPNLLPDGITEDDLIIGCCENGVLSNIDGNINKTDNTITLSINSFSSYAIMAEKHVAPIVEESHGGLNILLIVCSSLGGITLISLLLIFYILYKRHLLKV